MNSMYHDGMRELQDDFDGRRVADALESRRKHRDYIRDALPHDDAHRAEVGSLEPPQP
jgi:hypothetical protein